MPGATIGHYRVIEELGSGDGGVVYLAEDLRLRREVALKVPRGRSSDDEVVDARFRREARIACSLSHPHLCTVHDVAEDAGRPFMALERLHGSPLDRVIAAGPLPLRTALDIAVDLCDALAYVHAKGVVHHGVLAANVFMTLHGEAKLLDFGTASVAGHGILGDALGDDEVTRISEAPSLPPDRATPEQGPAGSVDGRADICALGALLDEMVTGRSVNAPEAETAQARPLPAGLDAIVARACDPDPDRRYPSAAAMREAIQAFAARAAHGRDRTKLTPRGSPRRSLRRSRLLALCALAVAAIGIGTYWWWQRPVVAPLGDRDLVLIGAFTNTTGETVFDDTLRHALAMHLSQSPFLSIVGDDRMGETLRLMGRPATSQVTPELAREVCERVGAQAAIEGSIAPRANGGYTLGLVAVACRDGQPLARETADAGRKEDVLARLGRAASALRASLGESLPSLDHFDVPIERATTASLEALRAYTQGVQARARGQESESVPYFERAVAIDPHFASAYSMLSMVYGSAGDAARGADYGRRAFETSAGVSERERLLILFQYYDRVTGDLDKVVSTLAVWERSYPRDFSPSNALALVYNRIGQFEDAVARGEEARRRNPDHPFPYSNLAYAYRGLNRWQEARATAAQAVERGIATIPTRRLLYQLALLEGDAAAADRHLQAVRGRDREFDLVGAHAQALAFAGRRREALARYDEARAMADRGRFAAIAAGYALQAAWTELLFGYPDEAERRAAPLLSHADAGVRLGAAAVLALAERPAGASQIADAALKERREDTLTVSVSIPMVRAALALARNDARAAVSALEPARPYDVGRMAGLGPPWLRGTAYLRGGDPASADAEFRRVLAHRGTDPFSIFYATAPLGRARSLAAAGKPGEALGMYDALLAQWREADADLAVLREAREEAARLRGGRASRAAGQ